jgi:hypothetical protein
MKTYFEMRLNELHQEEDFYIYKKAIKFCENSNFESCHDAAQKFEHYCRSKQINGVVKVTGYFVAGFEHSWCETKFGNIIDLYPVGTIGGPLLIAKELKTHLSYFTRSQDESLVIIKALTDYHNKRI